MNTVRRTARRLVLGIVGTIWRTFGLVVPKNPKWLVLCTVPDFDDAVRSLQAAAAIKGYEIKLLLSDSHSSVPAWVDRHRVEVRHRFSVRGIWLYHRGQTVLFSHGLFSRWRPNSRQIVVNIWHGLPIKRIGYIDGKLAEDVPKAHYTIAHLDSLRGVMADAFGLPTDRVLDLCHPRIDSLNIASNLDHPWSDISERLVLWLPTYRESRVGDVRIDGQLNSKELVSRGVLNELNELMRRHNSICVIKPHPMSSDDWKTGLSFDCIRTLSDGELQLMGLTLYQLLARASVLITDLSSVYFDFKVTGRPIVIFFPDIDYYVGARGLVFPIEQLVTERVCVCDREFFEEADAALRRSAVDEDVVDLQFKTSRPTHGLALLDAIEQLRSPGASAG